MRELREHLERETGRKCTVRFYEHQGPTDEERADQELEDYLERLEHNVQFRSDVAYDAQTWALIYAGVLTSTDPAEYGFDAESLRVPSFGSLSAARKRWSVKPSVPLKSRIFPSAVAMRSIPETRW